MGHRLKFILLLLTTICYFNSAFEWDSKECKQNYQNENHYYISSFKSVDNSVFHFDTPTDLPTSYIDLLLRCDPTTVSGQPFFYSDHKPPDKIYLRQHSLLI